MNTWAYELEEQEKSFLTAVTQVNAWDRLLLESGDKVQFIVCYYTCNTQHYQFKNILSCMIQYQRLAPNESTQLLLIT
jgi:hypothetical protein